MSSCVCVINLCICSCLFSFVWPGLLVTPRCFCESALPCLALMSTLKTIIWVYSSSPCSSFLPAVCTVTEDQTYKVSGAPSPRFVLFVFESLLFWFLCLSVPRQGSRHSSFRPSPRQVGVGVRRDRREWRESAGREPSCLPIVGDIRCRLWLFQARRLVV